MQNEQIRVVARVFERLLPKQILDIFELKSWAEVFSIAQDLNLLLRDYLLYIGLLYFTWVIFIPQKVVYFHCEKPSE